MSLINHFVTVKLKLYHQLLSVV